MRLGRYDTVSPTTDQRNRFDCGEGTLNRWLATQAGQSMASRDAVTYLLVDDETGAIAGYYCLSAGEVRRDAAPPDLSRRAPVSVPVVRMGRFAIDYRYQGHHYGADLLREALLGAVAAGELIGARALLVDAISEQAKAFYLHFGFEPSPIHPMQLLYDIRAIAAAAGPRPLFGAQGASPRAKPAEGSRQASV